MNRRMVLGLILVGSVLAAAAARAADPAPATGSAPATGVQKTPASPGATAPTAAAEAPDLNGDWRLDPSRSDAPPRPPGGPQAEEGHGGWSGHGGGGHHGGGEGHRDGGGSGRGGPEARPARLPDLMHVTQTKSVVSFEDTTGHVVREITTVPASADTFAHAPGAQLLSGTWSGGQLVVERTGGNGFKLTETIALEGDQRSLVILTKVEDGSNPAREFKRVYRRMPSS
ncbi:MAG TPA: hypothetical protein VI792_09070 [Candidatus Eisenbacteria bacterium]